MPTRHRSQPLDPSHPALSAERPLFVANRGDNTLNASICRHLRTLRAEQAISWEVCIASAFFNVPGFDLIAGELEQVNRVRLLLGAAPQPEPSRPLRQPGDPPEPEFTRRQVETALGQLQAGLAATLADYRAWRDRL